MNSIITANIIRFIVLVLIQVLVCNHINFLGYINPYPYIIFILLFPINVSRSLFLFLAFLLGISIDVFGNSGGVHAISCLVIALMRPVVLRWAFGVSYEFQTLKFSKVQLGELGLYVLIMALTHHLCLFLLEVFNLKLIVLILTKAVFSSIFTSVLSVIILLLFRKKVK